MDLEESVDSLQKRFRAVEVIFQEEAQVPAQIEDGWINLKVSDRRLSFVDSHYEESGSQERWREAFPLAMNFREKPMALRQIFVELAKKYRLSERDNLEVRTAK